MTWLLRIASILLVALAACQPTGEDAAIDPGDPGDTAADTISDEEALDDLRERYETAFTAGDNDAMLALMTDDYREFGPNGRILDRGGIEAAMRDTTDPRPSDAELSIETDDMTIAASGDVAYGSGTSTFSATGPDGAPIEERTRWVAGFRKVDGEWRIDRLGIAPLTEEGETSARETPAAPADTASAM